MNSGNGAAGASRKILEDLNTVLTGEAAKMLSTHNATVLSKYGMIRKELEELYSAVKASKTKVNAVLKNTRAKLDPLRDRFDPTSKAGLDDLALFRFINSVGGSLIRFINESHSRMNVIELSAEFLLPALDTSRDIDLSSLMLAEESGGNLLVSARDEYHATVLSFERLLAGIYLGTRSEYKKLRKKFLGGTAATPDNDMVEEQLMFSLFGQKPPQRDTTGPAVALVDDNCVLTQLLIDISDSLPKYYEKVTPILKRGKLTGKTKTEKILDSGEIEDYAGTLIAVSTPQYWTYINAPNELTSIILSSIKEFQLAYGRVATALHALVQKADLRVDDDSKHHVISDPNALVKQYSRINFLSIRPSAEDIAPRTKMDHDLAIARQKLFVHMQETLTALSGMDRYEPATEEYAIKRVKEEIDLKRAMDDILRTDEQKRLQRNIQDENEFYVGKTGQVGALSAEREAAPKIEYKDVIGDSFVKAKDHIEEVVKVASHPHIMRLSAPRGDVKSNVLLIGPYGCGKTEMAKAIGGDKRIIGFNVSTADLLTAYMHESVKNIKRMYDTAKDLRRSSRYTKPVGILMDEFDRLFNYGEGVHQAYDGPRMTGIFQEMMDGVVGYEGVFLVAMTNVPKTVPEAILRRFKYVDVVGQLTQEERVKLFKMFLTRGLPVDSSVTEDDYMKWAEMLDHAPGDVIGKVTDEIHFKFMHEICINQADKVKVIERTLGKRLRDRDAKKGDYEYVKKALASIRNIGAAEITDALNAVVGQPQVKMQIAKAKQTYKDAADIMDGLAVVGETGFGFGSSGAKKSKLWT
jgi:SpoVK/Ycf46/Vps4 family AAA+-type ATPase